MIRPRRRTPPTLAWLFVALASAPGLSLGAGPATLSGWEPGTSLLGGPRGTYRLTARVAWDRGVPRETSRFVVRVTTPSGEVDEHALAPAEGPGARRLTVYVPADAVRNRRPEAVRVRVELVGRTTGAASDPLEATIADFPTPDPGNPPGESGPFGRGTPLEGPPGQGRPLPAPGPDGLRFIRVPAEGSSPGFFLAVSEATNAQVGRRLEGYDPRAGRSDEFRLEADDQPALGLSPARTRAYLEALGQAEGQDLAYRLPTADEWNRAARAGRSSAFWWGDDPVHPEGANLLGPEPALADDTTAPAVPGGRSPAFAANPWGLFHTFGNVEEWADGGDGAFLRLGGHFRTEPASPLPETRVEGDDSTGPDPYVGVRPAFDLTAEAGAGLVRRALAAEPSLRTIAVAFDPDRATATLTGAVDDPALRGRADRALARLWFLAAVQNQIEAPGVRPGRLARVIGAAGPARRVRTLGRYQQRVPVSVRWADALPVAGSDWYVNIYLPNGVHVAHRLPGGDPGPTRRITAVVEEAALRGAGVPLARPSASVGLSLGAPAPTTADPALVSDVAALSWTLEPAADRSLGR